MTRQETRTNRRTALAIAIAAAVVLPACSFKHDGRTYDVHQRCVEDAVWTYLPGEDYPEGTFGCIALDDLVTLFCRRAQEGIAQGFAPMSGDACGQVGPAGTHINQP